MYIFIDKLQDAHQERKTFKAGFTLIEIIVAITIVGLMMGLGFGAFRWVATARVNKARTLLAQLNNNIVAYEANTSQWPASLEDLVRKPANVKNWIKLADEDDLKDPWNREFVYKRNPRGAKPPYELYSYGPTGEEAPESEYISLEL